jgi:hypothetical protein
MVVPTFLQDNVLISTAFVAPSQNMIIVGTQLQPDPFYVTVSNA